jgi:hypothetical protein
MPTLGASPSRAAAGFPTLFSTASGIFGLVAGPSSASRPWILSEAFQLASTDGCATGLRTRSRHACNFVSRLDHLAQGQPRILSARSPCATGLASSLSGCVSFTVQRCLFRHRRPCGRFSRVLPRRRVLPGSNAPFVPPFSVFRLADLRFRRPPESLVPCWCAVTTICPLGNCDSLKGRNRPCSTSLDWQRLLNRRSSRGFLFRVYWRRANAVRGTGESCLIHPQLAPQISEGPSQPAWLHLSPVARDYL